MSNLKKILALVLALVMSFSLVTVSSAFKDDDQIDAAFAEAVEVLNGMGVFQGRDDGNFDPKGSITRAEVAAIIYRLYTGDVTDKNVSIYADYNKFDDVKSNHWFAGYVNYCANAEFIKGYSAKTFGPNDKVTGYQALAMILRAVGYDKAGEFTGPEWQLHVAQFAQQLHITDTVSDTTLNTYASRELVAELLFRTAAYVPTVTYTMLGGYDDDGSILTYGTVAKNDTLGEKVFDLARSTYQTVDSWGRPGYYWYAETNNVADFQNNEHVYAVIEEIAVLTDNKAVCECDIALALNRGGNTDAAIAYWTNGDLGGDFVNPIHQHNIADHKLGAQGSIIEVYEGPSVANGDDRIVQIDTYLAEVTGVTKQVVDRNNHVIVHPSNELNVFGLATTTAAGYNYSIYGNNYTVGQYILISITKDGSDYIEQGIASAKDAAQTMIWWNAEKHTIEGVTYDDNKNYVLDEAGIDLSTKYTWFFDQFNNTIGSKKIETPKTYAVVENVQWVNTIGSAGKAVATVRYMDGTVVTDAVIAKVNGNATYYVDAHVDYTVENFNLGQIFTTWQYNNDENNHLYEVTVNANGTLNLVEVAHNADAYVVDGEPVVTTLDGTAVVCYIDNYTTFMIFNAATGAYSMVTGYDALEEDWIGTVDYVVNTTTGYAKYVYIYGVPADYSTDAHNYDFVYFTNKASSFGMTEIAGIPVFVVYGVVNYKNETTPLYVYQKACGTVEATRNYLAQLLTEVKDELYKIHTTNGIIMTLEANDVTFVPVDTTEMYLTSKSPIYATFSGKGTTSTVDGNGVMTIHSKANAIDDYINVNTTTTILIDGEKGNVAELNRAILAGKDVYVVAQGHQALMVIVCTKTTARVDEAAARAEAALPTDDAAVQTVIDNATVTTAVSSEVETAAGAEAAARAYLESLGATSRDLTGYVIESIKIVLAAGAEYAAPALGASAEYTFDVVLSYNGYAAEYTVAIELTHAYTATEAVEAGMLDVTLPAVTAETVYATATDAQIKAAIVYTIENDVDVAAALEMIDADVTIVVDVKLNTAGVVTYDVTFVTGSTVLKKYAGATITLKK